MQTYTGKITRYEEIVNNAIDYDYTHRYSPNTEHKTICYNVEIIMDNGFKVWFYTPKINYHISFCPGLVIVTFDDKKYNWGKIVKNAVEKKTGAFNDYLVSSSSLLPSFEIGQTITITGRTKKEYGSKGITLSNVKLVTDRL
jgi:hypothetical protein